MQATLNAATYDLWNAKCGDGTWNKMEGGTLAWIVSCYFASGSAGKPHLEYKLRNLIMMTAGMQASDPFEISIQLEKIRKLKMDLKAEKLSADQILEAICKHPVWTCDFRDHYRHKVVRYVGYFFAFWCLKYMSKNIQICGPPAWCPWVSSSG